MDDNSTRLIRFDWAMKRILRDKANYAVLEGFLSVLLKEKIKIETILSSQSNKETEKEKSNDVDILIRNSKGELVIVEIQNTKEHDYFHRILFGAAKAITEYIEEGKPYAGVKKIISITVAYFDLGQGGDYVYHGTTSFKGLHKGDILRLSEKQYELYQKTNIYEIYPEFWIIKAEMFNENEVKDELDEWIYFFKTGKVRDNFTADGLEEAKRRLSKLQLNKEERQEYEEYLTMLRRIASYRDTEKEDYYDAIKREEQRKKDIKEIEKIRNKMKKAKEESEKNKEELKKIKEDLEKIKQETEQIIQETEQKSEIETVLKLYNKGKTAAEISDFLDITLEKVQQILKDYNKK
jgi:predicted transposase/invertase (TIGR01784 family)